MATNFLTQMGNFKEVNETNPLSTSDKLIVIEGPIGVGKTSLVRMLCDRWKAAPLFEVFEENPFLTNGFYEDTPKFAFNTEIFFLLSRFRQQQQLKDAKGLIISDYFFEKNAIFAEMNLDSKDLEIYKSVYDRFVPEVRQPDLIILLKADLESLMRRIYFRDRRFERSISASYLESLMNDYYHFFSSYTKAPVLTIPTAGLDFVNDPRDFNRTVSLIEDRIQGQVQLTLKTRIREAHA
ncbi:MAG: Deoxyadenosine kinase [Bacteriovoracaceae bacterium]|nr:Deoxyadenosine kinase [Bacteriovoracaceae bacterium]